MYAIVVIRRWLTWTWTHSTRLTQPTSIDFSTRTVQCRPTARLVHLRGTAAITTTAEDEDLHGAVGCSVAEQVSSSMFVSTITTGHSAGSTTTSQQIVDFW